MPGLVYGTNIKFFKQLTFCLEAVSFSFLVVIKPKLCNEMLGQQGYGNFPFLAIQRTHFLFLTVWNLSQSIFKMYLYKISHKSTDLQTRVFLKKLNRSYIGILILIDMQRYALSTLTWITIANTCCNRH